MFEQVVLTKVCVMCQSNFDIKDRDRMALKNPRKLWSRKCSACADEMLTTFSPDRPDVVVCERCYEQQIIQ